MRVGGDRVDQPVGAELMRVVDQDRHPGLQVRPHGQAGLSHVPLAQRLVLGAELRDDGGDDCPVE
jgi:hypothetical protein